MTFEQMEFIGDDFHAASVQMIQMDCQHKFDQAEDGTQVCTRCGLEVPQAQEVD